MIAKFGLPMPIPQFAEVASKAVKRNRMENIPEYFTFAYKRMVDKFLQRQTIPIGETLLEDLANAEDAESSKMIDDIVRELLKSINPENP